MLTIDTLRQAKLAHLLAAKPKPRPLAKRAGGAARAETVFEMNLQLLREQRLREQAEAEWAARGRK